MFDDERMPLSTFLDDPVGVIREYETQNTYSASSTLQLFHARAGIRHAVSIDLFTINDGNLPEYDLRDHRIKRDGALENKMTEAFFEAADGSPVVVKVTDRQGHKKVRSVVLRPVRK